MDNTFWFKQEPGKPLFPDLLWNRPENRLHAGKLLIIGGNSSGFRTTTDAYGFALKAGIGSVRILLPESLRKTVGNAFLELGEYAPSTPSGSFSYKAFAELLMHSKWADGVLLAGDFGRNSETAQLLEYFVGKYDGQLTLAGDSLDHFLDSPNILVQRSDTLLAPTAMQLQKLGVSAKALRPFTSDLGLQNFAEALHEFAQQANCSFTVTHNDHAFVAAEQKISSTPIIRPELELAARASVWWLQNPSKTFDAMTTSLANAS
ncbi:MAG: hypothetical protein WBP26_03625 [Candidatus Saccharimonadales bacterium]